MQSTALGYRLETLNDGLTTFANGQRAPMPLIATDINVQILAGAAKVTTKRRFCNAEKVPIEAIMTFPVGFDAVVTELSATIDGRRMVGVAQQKTKARHTYETALDEGRMSVLHEEALRGIHILSVGALPPGAEVFVELEQMVPMTEVSGKQFLRLPMTAGQLYGNSPLLPADDIVTSNAVRHEANLYVATEEGHVFYEGRALEQNDKTSILLNRAVELVIEGGTFGVLQGRADNGRAVVMSFTPTHGHDASLDLHILVDRSGSTKGRVGNSEVSIWQAMRDGLDDVLRTLHASDQISLWQFDNVCQFLGTARGDVCSKLVGKMQAPNGGTELSGAVRAAIAAGAKDLLVLTDGQTWAHIVDELKNEAVRISSILVGAGSLDANVGHLCAMTGGQVFYAPGQDVSSPLRSAFEALRTPGAAGIGEVGECGPEQVTVLRGGITIQASWSGDLNNVVQADAIGRFAAALAIPLFDAEKGEAWARAHNLCTHSTSLVLVDDTCEATVGFSQMRKVPAMEVHTGIAYSSNRRIRFDRSPARLNKISHTSYGLAFNLDTLMSKMSGEKSRSFVPASRKESKSKGMIGRFAAKLRSRDNQPEDITFEGFEWDRFGDALLSGDNTSLDNDQLAAVLQVVEALRKLGEKNVPKIGSDALTIYALGLMARKMGDRLGARFARQALSGAPNWVLEHRA